MAMSTAEIRSLRGSNPKSTESRFAAKIASSLREYEENQLPRNLFLLLQLSAIVGIVADTNCPEMPNAKKRKRWPEVVRIGSAQALIYRTRERKMVGRRSREYERFTVTY